MKAIQTIQFGISGEKFDNWHEKNWYVCISWSNVFSKEWNTQILGLWFLFWNTDSDTEK